jgi:hypothetical protein
VIRLNATLAFTAERQVVGQTGMLDRPIRAVLVGALVLAAACDPGWDYHVPDPPRGRPESSRDEGDVGLQIRGGLSTGMLSIEIVVTNGGPVPLVVRADAFRVLDASLRPLPRYWGHPPARPCEGVKQDIVALDRGQVCTMRGNFRVRPNTSIFGGRNKALSTLTVIVDGLATEGAPISRSATLQWD